MNQPSLLDVALIVAAEFKRFGVPHLVGGSTASMIHGEPRLTNDVDFAAVMKPVHVAAFVEALQGPFHADEILIRDAIRRHGMFNVIHINSANKIDVHAMEPDRFQASQLERAVQVQLNPPRDALGVLKTQRQRLDLAYMRSWARELDLSELLERLLREADIQQPRSEDNR